MTDLVERLRKRAEIRRQIPGRKSVENGEPDRLADLLEEAASQIELLTGDGKVCARCGAIAYDPVIAQSIKGIRIDSDGNVGVGY